MVELDFGLRQSRWFQISSKIFYFTLKMNRTKSWRIVACMTFSCMHLVVMSWNRLIYTRGDTELSIIKIGNIRQISLAMLIKRILTKNPSFYFLSIQRYFGLYLFKWSLRSLWGLYNIDYMIHRVTPIVHSPAIRNLIGAWTEWMGRPHRFYGCSNKIV